MSRKFTINRNSQPATPSTAKAVANATPVTHAFAQVIMDKYTPDVDQAEDNDIQSLFDKWPNDETTQRLAQLTELLTGYKPLFNGIAKIGTLFKVGGKVYATFFVQSGYIYGLTPSAKGVAVSSVYVDNSGVPKANAVTRAEAGLFSKELLSVAGSDVLSAVASYGGPAVSTFLKAIGTDVV